MTVGLCRWVIKGFIIRRGLRKQIIPVNIGWPCWQASYGADGYHTPKTADYWHGRPEALTSEEMTIMWTRCWDDGLVSSVFPPSLPTNHSNFSSFTTMRFSSLLLWKVQVYGWKRMEPFFGFGFAAIFHKCFWKVLQLSKTHSSPRQLSSKSDDSGDSRHSTQARKINLKTPKVNVNRFHRLLFSSLVHDSSYTSLTPSHSPSCKSNGTPSFCVPIYG